MGGNVCILVSVEARCQSWCQQSWCHSLGNAHLVFETRSLIGLELLSGLD